jgi:uncharacterized protein (TIGR01777 family)
MRIAVTGSTGLIGTALIAHLTTLGHTPVPVVRRAATGNEISWDPAAGRLDPAALSGVDAVVHLAGAGIGDKRWTPAYKKVLLESRTRSTNLLSEAIAAAEERPKVLLSGSAIGIYGADAHQAFTEDSPSGTGFLADICVDWETCTKMAEAAGVRVAHLRTGIVLSPEGGALKKQLPLFKLGLGGRFGNGRQWQSWISITDEVAAITHLLTSDVEGPVNLTAPNPVTNAEFTSTLAKVLKRPALLPIPSFGPKLLLGSELANNLLFTGQKVLPSRLSADGFSFSHPDLETALRALLNK